MRKSKQELILPTEFNEDLAEETGIHIGDGSMNMYTSKGRNHYGYVHSAHVKDDSEYSIYVKTLLKKLYNLLPYEKIQRNCRMLIYTSKDLIYFKHTIGLPLGKKESIKIPLWVIQNENFKKKCVRGIVDTDGCIRFRKPYLGTINNYPEIKVTNKSKELILQLKDIFIEFGLKPYIHKEEKVIQSGTSIIYNIHLNGRKNITQYIEIFGFSNPKHLNKYLFWKKYGFYKKENKNGSTEI